MSGENAGLWIPSGWKHPPCILDFGTQVQNKTSSVTCIYMAVLTTCSFLDHFSEIPDFPHAFKYFPSQLRL